MAYTQRYFNCLNCKIEITTIAEHKKFCSNKCRGEYEQNTIIQNWKNGIDNGLKVGGRLKTSIRKYLFKKYDSKCCKCGWGEINPHTKFQIPPLEVNHLDGNSLNNKEENLELICPNCHALTPTYKALNRGKANKERLAYSRMITA